MVRINMKFDNDNVDETQCLIGRSKTQKSEPPVQAEGAQQVTFKSTPYGSARLQRIEEGKRSTLSSDRRHLAAIDKRAPTKESLESGVARAYPPKSNAAPATSLRKQQDIPRLKGASSSQVDAPPSNSQKPWSRVGAARPRTSNLNSSRAHALNRSREAP